MRASYKLLAVSVTTALFGAVQVSMAQESSTEMRTDSSGVLEEIIITATKVESSIQDTPIAVTAFSQDQLDSQLINDTMNLQFNVPNMTMSKQNFTANDIRIRGIGSGAIGPAGDTGVGIHINGMYQTSSRIFEAQFYDTERVEVLRGPQGSLFGRNTTAGIIKFDTNRPTMDWQGRASASYGSYNTVTFDGGVGGPIVADKLAFRVSALYQRRDDWVDNVYDGPSADGTVSPKKDAMGGFEEKDVRLQLLMAPSDMVSMLTSVHARDYEGTSTIFHRAGLTKGSNSVADEPRSQIALDEAMDNPQAYKTYGASEHITLNLGGVTLTSITAYETTSGYSRGDTDGGAGADYPVNGVANGFGQSQGNVRDLDQLTQEIRLASDGDGRFKWQVGGLYFDQRDTTDFYQRAYFLTGAANNPNNWVRLRNKNESWALFGQASYELAPGFTLTAGGRYTKDIKETRLVRTAANAAGVSSYAGRRYVRLKGEEPSWDVSALYEVNPNVSLYARVARGFRGPTIQGRSAVFNIGRPETVESLFVLWYYTQDPRWREMGWNIFTAFETYAATGSGAPPPAAAAAPPDGTPIM